MTGTRFGVHTGLQHTTPDELRVLWTRIEALGFDWISIWDHFYGATGQPDDAACLEAVAMHAALACETERVECGSLVYSIGYRHPAVLAKAITAIDLISGGRAAMGIGAGWAEVEYRAYGIDFPSIGTRMDQLEEGIAILRGLLHDESTTFEGHVVLDRRRPQRAAAGAGQAADLGRRRRREAHAAHRRPVRRRVERAVRRPADVRRQARGAAPPLRRRRARPVRDPLRRQRRPRLDRGEPPRAVRGDRPAGPSRGARRFGASRSSTASASTSPPAPTR